MLLLIGFLLVITGVWSGGYWFCRRLLCGLSVIRALPMPSDERHSTNVGPFSGERVDGTEILQTDVERLVAHNKTANPQRIILDEQAHP